MIWKNNEFTAFVPSVLPLSQWTHNTTNYVTHSHMNDEKEDRNLTKSSSRLYFTVLRSRGSFLSSPATFRADFFFHDITSSSWSWFRTGFHSSKSVVIFPFVALKIKVTSLYLTSVQILQLRGWYQWKPTVCSLPLSLCQFSIFTDQRKVETDVEVTEDRNGDFLLRKPRTT